MATALGLLMSCAAEDELPLYPVERRDLIHRISAEGVLSARQVTPIAVPSEVRFAGTLLWLAPEGPVEAGEVIARFDATNMELRLEEGLVDLESNDLEIGKAKVEAEARLSAIAKDGKVAGLELDVAERYQKADTQLFSRHEILESRIDEELARSRQAHASKMHGVQQSLTQTELELLEVKRRRVSLNVDQARQGLASLEIRAPRAGLLSWERDWRGEPLRPGAQVFSGQTLGQIPDRSSMQAEVFVLEADAGGLEVGKPAAVTVEAYPERPYEATIERIDSVAQPRFRGSPVQYFRVILKLAATDPQIMKPGARTLATLLLAEVPDTLVVPRQALLHHDGTTLVQVVKDDRLELRAVEIGAQSLGLAAVVAGLEEGEMVALAAAKRGDSSAAEERPPVDWIGGGE